MAEPERTFQALLPEEPIEVVAGPLRLTIEGGRVRWVGLRGVEIVRGIYGAVRDSSWGTIEPRFELYEGSIDSDRFEVRFNARCVREEGGIDFDWTGTITGSRNGTIHFDLDGIARHPFMPARIGLCVLHPPRLAGCRVDVTTLFGRLRGSFPMLVTGYLPFSNVRQIRHDVGRRHETQIDFSGDVFQMEDQRAFSDGSFKTFSRPLELPQPYPVDAGTRVRQAITITIPRHLGASGPPITRLRHRGVDALSLGAGTGRAFPPVGTNVAPADVAVNPEIARAIRELKPAHLRATIDVGDASASVAMARAAEAARQAGCALEVVLIASSTDAAIEGLIADLAASTAALARVVAIDPVSNGTPVALAIRVRDALRSVGLDVSLAGGSRGHLYQLVDQGVPADLIDAVAYPINPQVHASDEASIMETLQTLPIMVRTAAALARDKPVLVGPVSLRALFDPYHVGPAPALVDGLPSRYDRRQVSPFAAAWTLGSAAALATAGAAVMTVHEAAGWAGLVAASQPGLPAMSVPPGTVLPVGRVVAALSELTGEEMIAVDVPPRWAAVAVQLASGRVRTMVANLGPGSRRLMVPAGRPAASGTEARLLTVDAVHNARWGAMATDGGVVEMPPYATAVIDTRRE